MAKGKKKTSRKGTKAWRASISTGDLENYVQKSSLEERTGGALDALPDDNLFFVDKTSDVSLVKKTAKYRAKELHCDAVLNRSSLVPPLLPPKKKIKKAKSVNAKILQQTSKKTKDNNVQHVFDIWDNATSKSISKTKGENQSTVAAAVEVDLPGCSYNPRFEDHQEALGLAVAQEMEKIYQKELEPPPIPRTVPGTGTIIDEEDLFFLEAGEDDDDDDCTEEDHTQTSRPIKIKKLTRAELNKKKRQKEQQKAEEESMKRIKIEKDLARLKEIEKNILVEEQAKKNEWVRRTISKQEKRAQGPPRLGKLKYKPEPVQVLLSNEVTGSLRKLKGCYSLARERYNSLQKRGVIEPRLPSKRGARKKRIEYEEGTKGHKEREMQFSTDNPSH